MKKTLLALYTVFLGLLSNNVALAFNETDALSSLVNIQNSDFYLNGEIGALISEDYILVHSIYIYPSIKAALAESSFTVCNYSNTSNYSCTLSATPLVNNHNLNLALFKINLPEGETLADYNLKPATLNTELPVLNSSHYMPVWTNDHLVFNEGKTSGYGKLMDGTLLNYNTDLQVDITNETVVFNKNNEIIGFASGRSHNESSGEVEQADFGTITSAEIIQKWLKTVEEGQDGTFNPHNIKVFEDVFITNENPDGHDRLSQELGEALAYLHTQGVINGYSNGNFEPNDSINRAELLKILIEAQFGTPGPIHKNCFTDVREQWFAPYVCFAKESEWVEGYQDNTFRPADAVTRAEAIKMLLEVYSDKITLLNASNNINNSYLRDVKNSDWFASYALSAKRYGLITYSYNDHLFYPHAEMTRGSISRSLYRMIAYPLPKYVKY